MVIIIIGISTGIIKDFKKKRKWECWLQSDGYIVGVGAGRTAPRVYVANCLGPTFSFWWFYDCILYY